MKNSSRDPKFKLLSLRSMRFKLPSLPSIKWGFADKTAFEIFMLLGTVAVPLALGGLTWKQASDAADNQRHEIMTNYFEQMKDLVLEGKLKEAPKAEISSLALASTRSTLSQLDGRRRGEILKYLYDSALITLRCPVASELQQEQCMEPVLKLGKEEKLNLNNIQFTRIPTFNSIDLENAQLSGTQLSQISLENAQMKYADLSRANLDGARMIGIDLSQAKLNNARLKKAILRKAQLVAAELRNADLECAYLREANLEEKSNKRTTLKDANLFGSDLINAKLQGAILKKANLSKTHLQQANLTGADLNGANLQESFLGEVVYNTADVRKLTPECYPKSENAPSRNNLDNQELKGANLTSASLVNANLQRANLKGVTLIRADLSQADLRGADLRTDSLKEAQLKGAWYNLSTQFPPNFNPVERGMTKRSELSDNQSTEKNEIRCKYTLSYCVPIASNTERNSYLFSQMVDELIFWNR